MPLARGFPPRTPTFLLRSSLLSSVFMRAALTTRLSRRTNLPRKVSCATISQLFGTDCVRLRTEACSYNDFGLLLLKTFCRPRKRAQEEHGRGDDSEQQEASMGEERSSRSYLWPCTRSEVMEHPLLLNWQIPGPHNEIAPTATGGVAYPDLWNQSESSLEACCLPLPGRACQQDQTPALESTL